MTQLPSPLALICHDAGAANLAFAWVKAIPALDIRSILHGPAKALALEIGLATRNCVTLDEALDGAHGLLSGTGWSSDLEHDARRLARACGVHSIAVLDHWVNYPARFERRGEIILPDELWVVDAEALALAREHFPSVPVIQQPNLYLKNTLRRIGPLPSQESVLYLLEPARSDWGRGEPGEFQALDFFMRTRSSVGIDRRAPVWLRPHPSDPPGKYDTWLCRHEGAAYLDTRSTLPESISRATWVAGCETAALVVGLAAGRKALCTLPPWAPACRLPHQALLHLRQIASALV